MAVLFKLTFHSLLIQLSNTAGYCIYAHEIAHLLSLAAETI